jgi:UDP-N-acetylmuramoyl-tripeptide--D-alanyl-D-alanine ligase
MSSSIAVDRPATLANSRKRRAKDGIDAYLGFFARLVVRARRPRVVGVTGSVGKTTTKDVIAAVLSHADARSCVGTVFKTFQNLNNNRGLPLTVLGYRNWPSTRLELARRLLLAPFKAMKLALIGPYPDTLVLEYAAADDSDMSWLVSLVRPTVAVVTAIGPAHLDYFRTVERIAEAKGALVRGVDPHGLVVLAADNPYASGMDSLTSARVVKVAGRGRTLSENAARAVGAFLGVPPPAIETALAEKVVVRGRLDVQELKQITLVDDSFNASPLSMQLGLDTIAEWRTAGRKVAILGHMAELGPESVRYHQEIGAYAHARADVVVGVGLHAPHYQPHHWFRTADECAAQLPALLMRGDLVYVKGSHSVGLVRVVSAIKHLCEEWNRREEPASELESARPLSA